MAVVYIEEAHAADEWPIKSSRAAAPGRAGVPVDYPQHRSLGDRLAAAADFAAHYRLPLRALPVYADAAATAGDGGGGGSSGNGFQSAYAAWPIRWYLFDTRPAGSGGSSSGGGGGKRRRTGDESAPSVAVDDVGGDDEVYVRRIGMPDDGSFDLSEPLAALGLDPGLALRAALPDGTYEGAEPEQQQQAPQQEGGLADEGVGAGASGGASA
jgi:hypothetical protein